MDSDLLVGQPLEPAMQLPALRAWRVTRWDEEAFVVQAHQLNPEGEMLNFVTYILVNGEPVGQITRLVAKGAWTQVEAISVQPEGASVQ